MGIGKFQSILILFLSVILFVYSSPAKSAGCDGVEAEGYCWTKDEWAARQHYLNEQKNKQPLVGDDRCSPDDSKGSGNVTYGGYGSAEACRLDLRVADQEELMKYVGGSADDADLGTGPCADATKKMNTGCRQANEQAGFWSMLRGMSAGAQQNSQGAAVAQQSAAAANNGALMFVGKTCLDAAGFCEDKCSDEVERLSKLPKTDKNKNDLPIAVKNEAKCEAKVAAIKSEMGMNAMQLLMAGMNAFNSAKPLAAPPGGTPPGVEPPPFTFTSTPPVDYGPGPGSLGDPESPGYAGNIPSNKSATYGSNEGSNGAGGGMGGGAYPGGAPNDKAGGAAASGFKDPGGGLSGGGGYSVSGVPFGGGGGGGYAGNGRDGKGSDGLDLSKFLPGAENDPAKRGLASAEKALQGQGITGANDLSNFEKVSRMMNKKRAVLKP